MRVITALGLILSCGVAAAFQPVADVAPAPKTEGKAWDIASPPTDGTNGGWRWKDVALQTDEGTWMSLDVSPDGRTIVFDLLGDLYTMPIEGSADGSAVRCIAEGLQWDMQPRFSPDGQRIAFVSDRTGENGKGGDNIWTMKVDGSDLRQITKESFRLLTQPVWTPDGRSIVARKHFTSRRSLGAGEMWLYDASGKTDGVQLTAKQSEQKDTGEPAVSADGRYLYYSLDASGGANFEYDKDSNAGIYAIDRLDMRSQQTERVVAGPGGACRPVPSPDGTQLAFVRRVRFQSKLFVMDLASGATRAVYGDLERDLQETWAVHGVYPAMAWMPDGKSIVFWAKGKIRRVEVASGEASVIPFAVTNPRKVAEALRFPIEVAPAQFDVRMLQSVQVSPDGQRVVFQALGHLWVRDMAGRELTRLTGNSGVFEYYPAWSRDGSQIAYITWNDEQLATVRVRDLKSGRDEVVSTQPGHYTDAVFSPDGGTIVFMRGSGGYLTSPLWSRDGGVYAAANPLAPGQHGGAMRRISTRGGSPQFGASAERLFLTVREGGSDSDKVSLVSIPLGATTPGDGERTHYKSDWATEFRVSPDGAWLAFAERYSVFVTPFMETGKAIDVGPSAKNVPVVKVSASAGQSLHWSGDSSKLHWSLGPELFTQDASVAMGATGMRDAAGVSGEKPAAGAVSLGFKATTDVPTGKDGERSVIAIVNAKLVTMANPAGEFDAATRGMRVIERGTIVIEGNRITAVGEGDSVKVPAGARVFDATGRIVTPGFIDVHAHGGQGENGFTPQRNWISHANLAFGVTTIHDPSNDTESIFAASELAKAGMILSPRTYSTGTILYGATGAFRAEVESIEDAVFHLSRMKAVGAFSVKSYNQPRRDQRQMVLEAARRLGMMVVPEGGALYQHNMTMVADGHTSVEHTVPVGVMYGDALVMWGQSATGYTPTLGVAYGGLGGENYWYARTKVWENGHLLRFVPRWVVDPRSRRRVDAPDEEWNHVVQARIAKALLDRKQAMVIADRKGGGGPTIGAHGQLAGLAAHWEMAMMVQGGMSPMEALRAATIDGAWYVGLDGDLGSIEVGKLADLAIFAQDPTADIGNTASISHVMLNGRLYNARDLAEEMPRKGDAPVMFFEKLQREGGTPMALEAIMRKAAESGGVCEGCGRSHN